MYTCVSSYHQPGWLPIDISGVLLKCYYKVSVHRTVPLSSTIEARSQRLYS